MEYYVAKSYETWLRLCDPYEINGKMYVKVRTPRGAEKVVRAYDKPQNSNIKNKNSEVITVQPAKSRRDVLGFGEAGYIWLFKNATYELKDWFKASPCRYTKLWGWYLPSDIEMPNPIPAGIEPIKLEWSEISLDNQLIADNDITTIVNEKLYDAGSSKWVGNIGDRLTIYLTCTKTIEIENIYGSSTFHIFTDENENIFTWTTTAKHLEEDHTYYLTGTVKEHNKYKNQCQTTLTRCNIKEDLGVVNEENN